MESGFLNDLNRLLTPRLNEYIKHSPTSKQIVFLLTNHIREVMYGGAAGGGKSVALLIAALQYVDYPEYSAILFRRTYSDLALPGALMSIAHEWLNGTEAKWSDKTKTWTFPSGATLTFGYLETENDKYRYQGAQFHFVGFDELTQFTESQYLYLFSRLRRSKESTIPIRMRAASNPGGIGHDWVRNRFITPHRKRDRLFVPASLRDNPHLDKEEYTSSLMELDVTTREQLLNGDWDIFEKGRMFEREWFKIIEPNEAPEQFDRIIRSWDLAASEKSRDYNDPDYTVGIKLGQKGDKIYVLDLLRNRKSAAEVEKLIRLTAELDGSQVEIFIEQEPGASGKALISHYQNQVLQGFRCTPVSISGDKPTRAHRASSLAEQGKIILLKHHWNYAFLRELELVFSGAHDDQADALANGVNQFIFPTKVVRIKNPFYREE